MKLKKYLTFFRIRFAQGLQYRAAAFAGIATQFAWGFAIILQFKAFYTADASAFPMEFPALVSYIWLQQAFLALFMAWFFDNDIIEGISSGNVAYELCRPVDVYSMWFVKSASTRVSRVALRFIPILAVAFFLPEPFRLSLPASGSAFLLFLFSLIVGLLLMAAFNLLVYISCFYTLSSKGIRILSISLTELLSGALIPLPFFPDSLQSLINFLPFASIQNTPFLIYGGHISGGGAYKAVLLQVIWFIVLGAVGKVWAGKSLKRVIVQGG